MRDQIEQLEIVLKFIHPDVVALRAGACVYFGHLSSFICYF